MATARRSKQRGSIEERRGRYYAYYTRHGRRWAAPGFFGSLALAQAWLAGEYALIDRGEWTPPTQRAAQEEQDSTTFAQYAAGWIDTRLVRGRPIADATKAEYRRYLKRYLSEMADIPLSSITREQWSAWLDNLTPGHDAQRAKVYSFTRSVLASAVEDGLIGSVPLHRRGAGRVDSDRTDVPIPTPAQVRAIADAMVPEHRLAVLLSAYVGGMRFEEVTALQRRDVHLSGKHPHIDIRRANTRSIDGSRVLGPTKTKASRRTAHIPAFLLPEIRAHLKAHAQPGREGLLFPGPDGGLITPARLVGRPRGRRNNRTPKPPSRFYAAAESAGRPEIHYHDLRHYFGTMLALKGAGLADIMRAMGHTTTSSALKYQNTAAERGPELAALFDDIHAAELLDAQTEPSQPGGSVMDRRAELLAQRAAIEAELSALPDAGQEGAARTDSTRSCRSRSWFVESSTSSVHTE